MTERLNLAITCFPTFGGSGLIATEIGLAMAERGHRIHFIARDLPFGRFGRADEVGDVVAFMASPRASWVSGASIVVDGCKSKSNL